jgi:mannosyl-oligosaccharide alpha-1,2-mannosidase
MFNGQNHNLLRPETAESLFLLWRATKDPIYRERGWAMFLAFDRWCRVPTGGFAGLRDVTSANPAKDDTMQSFWLAETLKYLFLLFKDDDALDLERWVLTTEAHPIRVMDEPPTEDAIRRWKAQAVAGRQS